MIFHIKIFIKKNGGERRIRTFEGWAGRFTVWSLWPLGNLSTTLLIFLWCRLSDSNQPPTDYKSVALPDELKRQNFMAEVTRLELATSCVTGKHSNQLSYTSINGGHNWARTNDPLLVRQVLSQLSYATIILFNWYGLGESNPCCQDENLESWPLDEGRTLYLWNLFISRRKILYHIYF